MNIKLSPLEIDDLSVVNFRYSFISPVNPAVGENKSGMIEIETKDFFSKYNIDIDFGLKNTVENNWQLFIKADINGSERKEVIQQPGYEIFIECIGLFKLKAEDDTVDGKKILIGRSSLIIGLNFLRNSLAGMTGQFPFGKYILPSIDIEHLIEKKKEIQKQNSDKKLKTIGKKDKVKTRKETPK